MANRAPATGVPNTAAKPALIPQMTSRMRSMSSRRRSCPNAEHSPPPICAQGPTLPADPPLAIVTIVAMNLTGIVRGWIFPPS